MIPFEQQDDDLKKKLAKYNEAKMVLYNVLPKKEYERIFMFKMAKDIWQSLLITYQGNSQVKDNKIDILVQQYEQFTILEEESIDSGFARFNTIITSLKALDEGHPKWRAKVTAIEELKDFSSLALDELISNLKVNEVVMEKDSEIYKGKKERIKSIALKDKKESSDDEILTSRSDDEEYAMNSDSENDAEDKTNNKTCLMAQSSNKVTLNSSYYSDNASSLDNDSMQIEYNSLCEISLKIINKNKNLKTKRDLIEKEILELNEKIKKLERSKEIKIACKSCEELKLENSKLKETQVKFVKFDKSANSLREMSNNQKSSSCKVGLGFDSGKASTSGTKTMSFVGSSAEKRWTDPPYLDLKKLIHNSIDESKKSSLKPSLKNVKESLNVTFDESFPPTKLSPLVDDDVGKEEAIKKNTKVVNNNNEEDKSIEVDKIVNIKESKNHPLDQVIGNLNQRTLRSQAQNHSNFFCFISTIEPKNVNEALKDESWVVAMQEELNPFVANDVWELVPLPISQSVIETKWVFRNKLDENGILSRNKARLVAQGYNQQEGIDYDETYAPITRLESIRILIAIACVNNFKLYQMDVNSAFLNGFINKEVYVAQLPGFIDFQKPNHV
ncbi:retrovirus-related pol polyprotein from transposon TNT 1-94 [Tanacetum coccineum]